MSSHSEASYNAQSFSGLVAQPSQTLRHPPLPSLAGISSEIPVSGDDPHMGLSENPNWLFDGPLMDEILVTDADFSAPATGNYWIPQGFGGLSNFGVEMEGSMKGLDSNTKLGSRKRVRSESSSGSGSKACREKIRRNMLNERFVELATIMEPGKPPKIDKAAILSDAALMVIQLRGEAKKLKESNESLQEKIKELKAEKNELRDEKQKLKAEKEQLEQQVKSMNMAPGFVTHPSAIPATYPAQGHAAGNKMVPFIGYPGFAMWQFMPPAAVDTSQDHVLRPPVA